MDDYYWSTEYPHSDNTETMNDWLNNHMEDSWSILFVDGSYSEVLTDTGELFVIRASGNGDFNHHKVSFVELF